MECERCGLPMKKHIASNGRIFWKCPVCGHEESTPDLDIQSYDSWEEKDDN